ncbi:hypothetical protein BURPSPAST_N0024 [Burkholderia pseudomallei Pasteur 52237]|nr:hypothetical protein BURPSPAST_N0024 [Burkholderia pseudomallei Pasteur 52237]
MLQQAVLDLTSRDADLTFNVAQLREQHVIGKLVDCRTTVTVAETEAPKQRRTNRRSHSRG